MFSHQFNPDITPGDARAKSKCKPVSDKELKGRNSFPGPDQNRLIQIYIKQNSRK